MALRKHFLTLFFLALALLLTVAATTVLPSHETPAALYVQQQTAEALLTLPKPSTIPFGIRLAFGETIESPASSSTSSKNTINLTLTWSTTAALTQPPCVELFSPVSQKSQYLEERVQYSRRQAPFLVKTALQKEKQPNLSSNNKNYSSTANSSSTTICGSTYPFIEPATSQIAHFIHTVRLDNLKYDKKLPKYQYRCGNDLDGWSGVNVFRPPPPPGYSGDFNGGSGGVRSGVENGDNGNGGSTNFLLVGDIGVAHALTLPGLIKDATTTTADGDDGESIFSALVHLGDIAYDLHHYQGRKGEHFLRMIEPISSTIPYMVAPGNHEAAFNFSHYRSFFKMPQWEHFENLYYSFDMGLVHIVVYNTEAFFWPESFGIEHMQTMFEWLEADLKRANENRERVPWILAMGHRPMYCSSVPQSSSTVATSSSQLPGPLLNSTTVAATNSTISSEFSSSSSSESELKFSHCGWEAEASRRGIPSICPHNNPRWCHRASSTSSSSSIKRKEEQNGQQNVEISVSKSFPIEELFLKYNVDMFVAGHVHDYERYWPVYNYTYTTYTEEEHDNENSDNRSLSTDTEEEIKFQTSVPQVAEKVYYKNPNATIHIISGAGGNTEMRIGPGLPPQGACSAETPWCAFQSGHGPSPDQGYDFSYSRVFVHNASHLQWQQVSATFGKVIDEFWVVQEDGMHRFL